MLLVSRKRVDFVDNSNTKMLASKEHADLLLPCRFYPENSQSSYIQKFTAGGKYEDLTEPTWTAHKFTGWFTEKSGSGTQLTSSKEVDFRIKKVYANWITPTNIVFDATSNGGTLIPIENYYYVGYPYGNLPSATGPSSAPNFAGWWTTQTTGGDKITSTSTVTGPQTLFARYVSYNDPIGLVICPTQNLYFTTDSYNQFVVNDSTITDGSGYVSHTSQNYYEDFADVFSSDYWGTNYMTYFKTSVTGPGTLSYDIEFITDSSYSDMACGAVIADDVHTAGNYDNIYATYCTRFAFDAYGNYTTSEIQSLDQNGAFCSGSTTGAQGPVSVNGSPNYKFSGSMTFSDSNTHPITFIMGTYYYDYTFTVKFSNVRWVPA